MITYYYNIISVSVVKSALQASPCPWETVINANMRQSASPRTADNNLPHNPAIYLPKGYIPFHSLHLFHLDMSLSPSSSFLSLYHSALQDYTTQTGTNLVDHPFAKQLENCESVDSISSLLQENVRKFLEFRGEDGKIIKSLKCAVHVLHTLCTSTVLGEGIGLVRPKPVIPISYT